jgi:hypothetical protein
LLVGHDSAAKEGPAFFLSLGRTDHRSHSAIYAASRK